MNKRMHITDVQPYTIAMYIRLSKEDLDMKGNENKIESNSITSQRSLLQEYIREHDEFSACKVIEKCDDGFSGKKFDRPEFCELLDMAKEGKVDCIIVKDFSRFGRDYVEIGNYLEQVFPSLGVRFISVNDHYDSCQNKDQAAGLEVAFKNVIYDFYSRDTSKKIRTVRRKLALEGSFASANAPYGYKKSKLDKHKLVINPDTAPVVLKIFELKLTGISVAEITRILNAEGIPSPAQYAIDTKTGMDWRKVNEKTGWDSSKVMAILRDERYTGTMVSLKRKLNGIYGKDTYVDKEDWVRVENTHEGIVSKEMYEKVQSIIVNFEKSHTNVNRYNPFTCGCCGRKISKSRLKTHYWCRYGEVNPRAECYQAEYDADKLEGIVLSELKWHINEFLQMDQVRKKADENKIPVEGNIELYEKMVKQLTLSKTTLYERYKDGSLEKEEYIESRKEVEEKIREYEEMIAQSSILDKKRKEEDDGYEKLLKLVDQYKNSDTLTKEIQEAFIDRVYVYPGFRIKIVWKFEDVFGN